MAKRIGPTALTEEQQQHLKSQFFDFKNECTKEEDASAKAIQSLKDAFPDDPNIPHLKPDTVKKWAKDYGKTGNGKSKMSTRLDELNHIIQTVQTYQPQLPTLIQERDALLDSRKEELRLQYEALEKELAELEKFQGVTSSPPPEEFEFPEDASGPDTGTDDEEVLQTDFSMA